VDTEYRKDINEVVLESTWGDSSTPELAISLSPLLCVVPHPSLGLIQGKSQGVVEKSRRCAPALEASALCKKATNKAGGVGYY